MICKRLIERCQSDNFKLGLFSVAILRPKEATLQIMHDLG